MKNRQWANPVPICLESGGIENVGSPFEAMIYLTDRWPDRTGPRFLQARAACKAALEGRIPFEEAHRKFVAAAEEVGIGGKADETRH